MKKLVRASLLGSLFLLFLAPPEARAWGIRTHRVFGWYAAQDTDGLPPLARNTVFINTNMLPDVFCVTLVPYCQTRPFGEYVFRAATNDTRLSSAYGFIAHQAEDTIGHNFYVTEGEPAHSLKEIGLDGQFIRSPDANERAAARAATVQGDLNQLIEAATLYTQENGGGPVPSVLQAALAGFLTQMGLVGEVVLTDNPFFYAWSTSNYPRSEWQGWMDQSISLAKQWVNEHAPGTLSPETRVPMAEPVPEDPLAERDIEMLLAELGMVALAEKVVRLRQVGEEPDGSPRFVAEISRPIRARKILIEFLNGKSGAGESLFARQLSLALLLTLGPVPITGAEFQGMLDAIRLGLR